MDQAPIVFQLDPMEQEPLDQDPTPVLADICPGGGGGWGAKYKNRKQPRSHPLVPKIHTFMKTMSQMKQLSTKTQLMKRLPLN